MNKLHILPGAFFAGHCTTKGSDKVWGACLARERSETENVSDTASEEEMVWYLCAWGRRGTSLHVQSQRAPLAQARTLFRTKSQEKAQKSYTATSFPAFLPSFGRPLGLALLLPSQTETSPEPHPTPPVQAALDTPPALRYASAAVKPITMEHMQAMLAKAADYGITEKVNGERCLLAFDGTTLQAYNRRSQPVSSVPPGAHALTRLQQPFVLDGERLSGGPAAGCYVVFDVLMLQEETLLALPYRTRLSRLAALMQHARLLRQRQLTPTLALALENSLEPELALLLAITGEKRTQAIIEKVQQAGGEGVVVRQLSGPYYECAFKYKFLADLDVCIVGIQQGTATGSLIMGLVRPTDQAVIEVGRVRSGLTNQDVQQVQAMLTRGERPVFRVEYLPARTVGIALVEPRTSLAWLRTDKIWQECLTDQFGPEKATLVATASPFLTKK